MARWREGINHPVQSFVSDLVNEIVVETFCELNELEVDERGRYNGRPKDRVRLCGQMHDSLLWAFPAELFDVSKAKALAIAERPRTIGNFTFQFPVSSYEKLPKENL
jgi:hypothetical protein